VSLRLTQRAIVRALPRPAQNAHRAWLTRETAIITLENEHGQRGFGEAAPLPGFSRDKLADCQCALTSLNVADLPERLELGDALLPALSLASSRLPAHLPAARTALEAALLDLWARARGVPAWALLRGDESSPATRRLAALLPADSEQARARAHAARSEGLSAFKLKVGRAAAIEQELSLVARLRAELGEQVDLRLDANRAWTAEQARLSLPRFAAHNPELIEEPCPLAQLGALAPSPIPLALDESLLELPADRAALRGLVEQGVRVLVLKPTLLGGISTCCAWAQAARACGVEVILSHTFEGPLGLAGCAALALAVGSETAAHGLELHGAGLELRQLPYFSAFELRPWSDPGFGVWEPGA